MSFSGTDRRACGRFLDALPKERHDEFLEQLTARLNTAYGTSGPMTFDFKRLFIWGRRPGP